MSKRGVREYGSRNPHETNIKTMGIVSEEVVAHYH